MTRTGPRPVVMNWKRKSKLGRAQSPHRTACDQVSTYMPGLGEAQALSFTPEQLLMVETGEAHHMSQLSLRIINSFQSTKENKFTNCSTVQERNNDKG